MITEQISAEDYPGRNERQSSKWDVKNARKNYISLVAAQVLSSLFAFTSVWLLTRTVGSEGYGTVFAMVSASQVVQIFVHWTSISVVRFGVDEFIETEKIARTFWLRFFTVVPIFLIVLPASYFWFPPIAAWFKLSPSIFWLLYLHFVTCTLWIHIQFGLQAVKMPRLQGGLLAVERALILATLLILLATGALSSKAALICYAAAPLAAALIGLWFLRKFVFARFTADWQFCLKILRFSLPLLAYALAGFLWGGYADAAFILSFLSVRELGIYAIAILISGIALQLPTLANMLLLPLFLSLQKEAQFEKLQNYFKHVFPTLILMWGLFVTFASFAGSFAIPLIFPEEFSAAIAPIWILLAASTFNVPILIGYASVSNATSNTYMAMYSGIFAAVVNVSFNFLLIPVFGTKGCAWATLLMFFVSSSVFAFFLRRKEKTPISWTFLAFIPTLGGAISFSVTENSWLSLAICLSATIFVLYLKKASFRETFLFIKRFGKI